MQEIKDTGRCQRLKTQTGLAAVEFAGGALLFFVLVFGIIEVARAFFICNTLQEVTRRAAAAAAITNFSDTAALDTVRRNAIFRLTAGALPGAPAITDANVRIEYLSIIRTGNSLAMAPATMPSTSMGNRVECMKDLNSNTCIRLVRVRICDSGTADVCQAIPFQVMVPLINLSFNLPTATTIRVTESLGFVAGSTP